MAVGAITCQQLGLVSELYEADASKLSFVILSLFTAFTGYIGLLTYRAERKNKHASNRQLNTCWFFADSMTVFGMVGTVIGFLIMLGLAFANLNVTEVASVQEAIKNMALGMSTALVTTLLGLSCGWLLKLQLVNYENQFTIEKQGS